MLALLTKRNFSLLWFAGLISVAGDFALVVATPLFVYERTDSTLATAGIFAARFVPNILLASIAGVFVDRWDRRRTMIAADLLRALVLGLLVIASSTGAIWLVYVASALLGALGLFFSPAENALLPQLVGKDDLVPANALNALNDNLGRLVGPAFGATLYAWKGLGASAIADALTFVGSAALIWAISSPATAAPTRAAQDGGTAFKRMLDDWRGGLTLVRQSRTLKVLYTAAAISSISEGIFVTLALAPFVLDVLGGTEAQVGWLGSAQAVGGLMAGVVVARYGKRVSKRRLMGLGMIGLGIADMSQFNARLVAGKGTPAVTVAMFWMLMAGFPAVAMGTGSTALLQEQSADEFRGRIYGGMMAASSLALLVGLGLAGVLGETVGIVPVLTASAALWMVAGIVVLAVLPEEAPKPLAAS